MRCVPLYARTTPANLLPPRGARARGGRQAPFLRAGGVRLLEDTAEKAREWVEKEGFLARLGPVHPKEAYSPECVEGTFSEIRNG